MNQGLRRKVLHLYLPYLLGLQLAVVFVSYHGNQGISLTTSCSPRKKIAFLKTHKCGSSTVENILFRHALSENLTVAVPPATNYFCKGDLFTRQCLSPAPWKNLRFDLFNYHTRWNSLEVKNLMGNDAAYISVLRDPVDVFESLFKYVGLSGFYGVGNLSQFVDLVKKNSSNPKLNQRYAKYHGRNQIAFDWGVPIDRFDDERYIEEQIPKFNQDFQLVLIAERMKESMVLLRRLMCWPLHKVAHLDINKRKTDKIVKLSQDEREILEKWLSADYKIYRHFLRKFEEQLKEFGAGAIQKELEDLRTVNQKVIEDCQVKLVDNSILKGDFHDTSSPFIMGYSVNESLPECRLFAMTERAFTGKFKIFLENKAKRN